MGAIKKRKDNNLTMYSSVMMIELQHYKIARLIVFTIEDKEIIDSLVQHIWYGYIRVMGDYSWKLELN